MAYYHAHLEYANTGHLWYNYSEEGIVEALVLPFINGQVIDITIGQPIGVGTPIRKLFNMKNATFLRVFKTDKSIAATPEKSVSQQIKDPEFQTRHDYTATLLKTLKKDRASVPTTSLLQMALQPPQPQIFVVMKFGDEILNSAYVSVIKPIAKRFKLGCIRVDEIPDSGKISDQILEKIAESKYIIADLTGARPNCYYEAGFAHALGKEMILTIRDGEAAHFDLQGHRFIQWKTESDFKRQLGKRLKALEQATGVSEE
jgi:hypothetical protein